MSKRLSKTKHHIIPKSRESDVITSIDIRSNKNITYLTQKTHDALHRLFGNKTPKEQLEMWYRINKKVLSGTVKDLIQTILSDPQFYI